MRILWPRNIGEIEMSVTVRNLLKLPSLANATVIAGREGLDKIVTAVSVLETMEYKLIDDHDYFNDEFNGCEIIITGFLNGAEDIDAQYNLVKGLALSGEAGLILYYVGVIVKKVDPSIIKLADELKFPIIVMPYNRLNLRYSEAITDIMGLIIRDQISVEPMIVTLLESISKLPVHQQNVGTMIRLISNRLRSSVILTTDTNKTLYEAAWPSDLADIHKDVEKLTDADFKANPISMPGTEDTLVYKENVNISGTKYNLYVVHVGGPLTGILLQQTVEAVRIALKLWGKDKGESVATEIVEAILTDQPIKMRSLSAMFNLDIASVDSMWVINGSTFSADDVHLVTDEARKFCKTVCADLYKESIVLFTDNIKRKADVDALRTNIETVLGKNVRISFFTNLKDTGEVRAAYLLNYDSWQDASRIMPDKEFFVRGDIEFASACRQIVEGGADSISEYLSLFDVIEDRKGNDDYVDTLCTFLLDANSNVQMTSEKMFVHKNTIKSRIKTMSDCLGFTIGSMPESEKLYKACGIKRILN